MKKTLIVAALLLVPSLSHAQGIGEVLQGLIDPHLVAGVGYNDTTKHYSAVLTANIVGPKLGSLTCYVSGAGVSLGTVAPGLDNAPIASASFPFLTCAPFGEKVAIQAGLSHPLNAPDFGNTYYVGAGFDLGGGPNSLKAKRIKRIEAKVAAAKAKKAEAGPIPGEGVTSPVVASN